MLNLQQSHRNESELMVAVSGEPGEWLYEYVKHARSLTDAPLAFHVGGGLVALAGAVGSNVWWYGGGARVQWPNLYVLLVGPSGTRKSTAVDLPTAPLANAVPGSILDREFTPERFIRNLSSHPTAVLKESEFSSLLERMNSNYMNGMKQRLTDLYDCHERYDRSIQGAGGQGEVISIEKPSLSILAASTVDWLVESIGPNDMRSGFLPRFLIISSPVREPEPPGGYFARADKGVSAPLVAALHHLSTMKSTKLDFDGVKNRLVSWAYDRTTAFWENDGSEELGGLYNRLGHHVAKVCALLMVSGGPMTNQRDTVVREDVAERAILFMEWVLTGTARLFDERVTFSEFERQAQTALRKIGSEVGWSDLLRRLHLSAGEFEKLINTLEKRGDVEVISVSTGGRPGRLIKRLIPDERVGPSAITGIVPLSSVRRQPGNNDERSSGKELPEDVVDETIDPGPAFDPE